MRLFPYPAAVNPDLCKISWSNNCKKDAAMSKAPITSAIDVWALGVTLFCFIFGRLPFNADHEFKLFKCIAEEELVIPHRRIRATKPKCSPDHCLSPEELEEHETEPVDDELRDLIKRLLIKNPAKRILLKEVKRHPWVLRGIDDPIGWVERNDPERNSHGNKIEVTAEDVETAVSVPTGIVDRAKSALRRAAGSWARGLRKRGSNSTTSVRDSKGKLPPAAPDAPAVPGASKQGQLKAFPKISDSDDPDKELQWMGRVGEPREDEKLNPLAPTAATASSAGSSETVHGKQFQLGEDERHDQQWFSGVTGSQWAPSPRDKRLRRKQSMNLLGANLLRRRHSTHTSDSIRATHRGPTEPPPCTPANEVPPNAFKAESTAALVAPTISRRIVRSTKSDDLARDSGTPRKAPSLDDGSPLRARQVLSGALYRRASVASVNSQEHGMLPFQDPQPRTLYGVVDNMENGILNIFPKSPNSSLKERIDRQRREEQELARRMLGKVNLVDDDDLLDQPCPPSPDDQTPRARIFGQENQRMMLEERERQRCTSNGAVETPEGWSRESFYQPARGWPTPPVAMATNSRRTGYFDPPSPKSDGGNLASSSSNEMFAITAGSSLTNSASFPSVATNPSSVSSDIFLNQYSRKGSFVPTEHSQDAVMDDEDRLKLMQAQARGRRASELWFQPEEEDSGSDSEGGFVMKAPKPKRTPSSAVGQLARGSNEAKDAALRWEGRPRYCSRNSGSTLKVKRSEES